MNYVKSLKMKDVDAFQIPCIRGKGAPTTATKGAVGCLYMDTATGNIYKCTAVADGVYTWVKMETGGTASDNYSITVEDGQTLTTEQLAELEKAYAAGAFIAVKCGIDLFTIEYVISQAFGLTSFNALALSPRAMLINRNTGLVQLKASTNLIKTVNGIPADYNGNVEVGYYSTTREDLAVTLGKEDAVPNDVTSERVWGLYDALMAEYSDNVQKNEIHNNDGTFTNYEYVISTGDYNTAGHFYGHQMDTDIKKPKYLILSGIHGNERPPIIAVYRFIRDVLEGRNVPAQFREGCVISVMPVGTPFGLDTLYEGNGNNPWRVNGNYVNINQNFDYQWVSEETPVDGLGTITTGTTAESEKETQAIVNWLKANDDAVAFFDCHIQGCAVNEVVMLMGGENSENYKTLKKIAMRGIERVIPFWRDTIGYPEETIFYSTETIDKSGLAIDYATEVLKIPSLALEISAQQASTQADFQKDNFAITAETVAADAEIIGNILMELHEQYYTNEVVDVKEVNEKLDGLAESMKALLNQSANGFRIETGVYTAEADLGGGPLTVPCTSGAKVVIFVPDDETFTAITGTSNGTRYLVGAVSQKLIKLPWLTLAGSQYSGYLVQMRETPNGSTIMESVGTMVKDDNSFQFAIQALKAGTYNWTAYYWND